MSLPADVSKAANGDAPARVSASRPSRFSQVLQALAISIVAAIGFMIAWSQTHTRPPPIPDAWVMHERMQGWEIIGAIGVLGGLGLSAVFALIRASAGPVRIDLGRGGDAPEKAPCDGS